MPLTKLTCHDNNITDLSPLKGLPLKELQCDFVAERDVAILRPIKTFERINGKPAAEFWQDVDAGKVPAAPAGRNKDDARRSGLPAMGERDAGPADPETD